jgi:uncharacterized protein (TIGR03790 family)
MNVPIQLFHCPPIVNGLHLKRQLQILAILLIIGLLPSLTAAATIDLELPKTGLTAEDLAVVVNDDDPQSLAIAEYYRVKRGIPDSNILHVRFASDKPNLPQSTFNRIRNSVLEQTRPNIQAYALAWTKPYRVDCMSITSAFTFGFDKNYCSKTLCAPTKASEYFDSPSHTPFDSHGIRPSMLLAGNSLAEVKRLIDRGVASDHRYPTHTGYLLNTSDKERSVRAAFFPETMKMLGQAFHLVRLDANQIVDKQDVLFYFTGLQKVEGLQTLDFVPGAIADHLTSAGGMLDGKDQMSSLRWLEAGATGSFGAVVEPCNHVQKFPIPAVVMGHYAMGDTLIEAYWKSVAWPGEGVFIGEPLAHPFAPRLVDVHEDGATLKLYSPIRREAELQGSESSMGPYLPVTRYPVFPGLNEINIHLPDKYQHYRLLF